MPIKPEKTDLDGADDPMREAFCVAITSLRRGEVSSYGEIAARAGYPRRHRAVGQLLSVSFDALPWWRVVYASGDLPPVNPGLQEQRLIEEGVTMHRGRVIDAPFGSFQRRSAK
ncbi:MAG: MGMT family protein [Planctomycetota bacterium]